MPSLNVKTLPEYLRRVEAVRGDEQRRWGTLTATDMFAHMSLYFEMSLERHAHPDISTVASRTLGKWLAFSVFTRWPGGKIKAPGYTTPAAKHDIELERQRLMQWMQRFVEEAQREPGRIGVSPLFGPMTLRYWRRAHGCHLNHHLRQFGV